VPDTPYENAKKTVETLDPAEQLRLVAELTARLSGEVHRRPRSLMELDGLGSDIWQGIDSDEYLRQERSSWSG
jgi:hypothetical protein